MSCSRGAASPDLPTQKRLFAASAGHCQNPGCTRELFLDHGNGAIHIAEMAHIIAANDDGPRADTSLSEAERGAFENLILLCSACHTIVDKDQRSFPDTILHKWKRDRALSLTALFGVQRFSSRPNARRVVEPLLAKNKAVFDQYGPHIDAARNPESGAAERWRRKMLTTILPTNHRIIMILDANRDLLIPTERSTLERFRQHVDDLQAFHIEGLREDASQFPIELQNILEG